MLSHNEQILLVSKLLHLSAEDVRANSAIIQQNGALYFSEPVKGGASILVNTDGSVLFADSSVDYDEHIKEFDAGRRTPLDAFE